MTVKEKADKMWAMTDEELVAYVENRVKKAYSRDLIRAENWLTRR